MFAMIIGYFMLFVFLARLMWIYSHLQAVIMDMDDKYTWDGVIPAKDYLVLGTVLLLGGVIFG